MPSIHRMLLALAFVPGQLAPSAMLGAQQPTAPRDLESAVDSLVAETMGASWSRVPGAAVAVVESGRVVLLKGYGVEDVETGAPVDPRRTVFHVASLSKPVTATALLQLVDEERLDPDADVNRYLDAIHVDAPDGRPVTPARLLTHTAGFDRRILGRMTRDPAELGALGDYLARRMPPVVRPPGTLSVYSNHGFALAGHLLETLDGVPFPEAVERRIFGPLGMERSSFALEPGLEEAMATGYGWRGADGPPEPRAYVRTVPASMLRTTAADMTRWMRAVLGDGALDSIRVLSPGRAAQLLRRQAGNHQLLPGRSYGLAEGGRFDPPSMIHAGGVPGFTSALVLHEELRLGIVVLLNSQAPPWDIVRGIMARYDDRVDRATPPPFLDAPVPTARLVGHYRNAEIPHHGPARIGALVEQARVRALEPGRIEWNGRPYRAVDSLAFRRVGGDEVVAFVEAGGRIAYAARSGGEYERVPWHRSRPVQAGLWLGFTAVFLGGCLAGGLRLVRRGKAAASDGPGPAHGSAPDWPLLTGAAAAGLNLLFVVFLGVGLGQALGGGTVLDLGLPAWLRVAFLLPPAGGLLALPAALGVLRRWREGWGGPGRRAALTLLALALLIFPAFLASWDLLGLPG